MTITLSPGQERIASEAIQAGLIERPEQLVDLGVASIRSQLERAVASPPAMDADEWIDQFRKWVHSHPADTPLLSEDAVSRASIYDRVL